MIKFLIHYFSSNSRHGTHSPFVYTLADEVIYNKKYQQEGIENRDFGRYAGKYNRLLQAIVHFLKVDTILIDQSSSQASSHTAVLKDVEQISQEDITYLSNYTVLVAFNLYKSRSSQRAWHQIKANDQVDVSIDLYYFGMLFHRPQQRKENFKLKYPFWI